MTDRKPALAAVAETALDLLYPPRCPFCEKIVKFGSRAHAECLAALPRVPGRRCAVCGKPVMESDMLCEDCEKTKHRYRQGMGAFLYEGTMRDAVLAFKFRGKKEYGTALGQLLAQEGGEALHVWKTELLIPVPMSRKKERKRGYNQAAVLASEVSREAGIPLRKDLVIRRKETEAMKALGAEARRGNLAEAFLLTDPAAIYGKNLCIIDDIYTTGATVDAMAAILCAQGAADVTFLTLCIGSGYLRDVI